MPAGRRAGGGNGSGTGQEKSTGRGHAAAGMCDSAAISSPAEGPLTSLSLPPRRRPG